MPRIHITGASGSGTTTLGVALSRHLGIPHFDSDNYFWMPTDPPYRVKRDTVLRNSMLVDDLQATPQWVLSGSVNGWASEAEDLFELVVYLWVPQEVRLERLETRETAAFGEDALKPGGAMHEGYVEFIEWAARYDTAGMEQRSKVKHAAWLDSLGCPVLRIEGNTTTSERVGLVVDRLN